MSKALVQSFGHGGISPCARFGLKLENSLHLPLSAQCGMIIGWMMHSLLAVKAVATSLIRAKMIYHSKLHLGLAPCGRPMRNGKHMRSAFKSVFLLAEFIRAF